MVLVIATAILLYPGAKTLTLMRYFNLEFAPAYQTYESLYESGDKTLSVINPLVKVNLDYARYDRAIELLEDFVEKHPDRIDVLDWLAEIYLGADKPHNYLFTLERSYAIKASQEKARILISYYGYYGNTVKWLEWLNKATTDFTGTADEYELLAQYHASTGNYIQAIRYAKQSVDLCQNIQVCGGGAVLSVSLLLHLGKEDEAFEYANEVITEKKGSFLIADFSLLFVKAQNPELAMKLLDTLTAEEKLYPANIEATLLAYSATKDDEMVYQYLDHLASEKKLDPFHFNVWTVLALTQEKDPAKLNRMLKSNDPSYLADSTWLMVVQKAYSEKNYPLLDIVSEKIPEDKLVLNPVLRYALEMARNTPPTQEDLSYYLRPDQLGLTDEETAQLAILYNLFGLHSLVKNELQKLPSFEAIPEQLLNPLTSLYIESDMAEEGYLKLMDLKTKLTNPSENLNLSWIMLSAATGRAESVLKYLSRNSELFSETNLKQIYATGVYSKVPEIQLKAAELLIDRNPSYEYKALLGEAWIANGETAKGISLLKTLYKEDPENLKVQIALLTGLSKTSKESSFDQSLFDKLLQKILANHSISNNDLRDLAFALADAGFSDASAQIFFLLAQSAEINSEDMDMLLYLWGNRIDQYQAEWLASVAALSHGKEKGLILSLLASSGYPDLVLPLVSQSELSTEEIFDAYLLALATLHRNEEITTLLAAWLPNETNLDRLKKLGETLRGNSLDEAAEIIYLKILSIAPEDREGLRELGNLYFNLGAFHVSYYYLSYYICLYDPDPVSLFHYAEIYNRDGDRIHAYPFYWAAINKITSETPKLESDLSDILAISYFRLNYPFTGINLLQAALNAPAKDRSVELSLRGTLANLLIDFDCLDSAVSVLFTPQEPLKRENREAILFLENLKTEWFRKNNDPVNAFAQSDDVLVRFRDKGFAWASRAALEDNYGHEWRSFMDYDIAIQLDPKNEDFWRSRKEIIDRHRSFIGTNWEYRKVGLTQTNHIYRYLAAYNPSLFTRYSLIAEYDHFRITSYTNAKTGLTDKASGNRYKNTLAWIQNTYSGETIMGEIYYAPEVVGAGAHYARPDLFGSTLFGLEIRQPNWDFAETIVEHGSRDRIFCERTQHLWERIEGALRIEGRKYHLHPTGSVAESIAWYGDITYTLPQYHWLTIALGKESTITSSYNIDAEYGTWTKFVTVGDNRFQPLSVGQREIHTVEMNYEKRAYRYFNAHARFGFAYDRFGGVTKASPVYGGAVSWNRRPGLTADLTYSHSPSTSTTNAEEDQLIFNLIYYY